MGILNSILYAPPEFVVPEPAASEPATSCQYNSSWNVDIVKRLPTKRKAHDANDGPPTEIRRVIRTPRVAEVPSEQARQGHPGRGRRGRRGTRNSERTRADGAQAPQRTRHQRRSLNTNFNAHQYNDLCVAVAVEPYSDLSLRQGETLKNQLEGVLDREIFTPDEPYVIPPQFRGKACVSDGVLKLFCNDHLTVCWLRKSLDKVPTPWEGSSLVIRKQSELPKKIKVGIIIPQIGPEDTLTRIHARLIHQNREYRVTEWNLYNAELYEVKKCIFLVVGIPEADALRLLSHDRRVFYKFGNLYVRFLEEGSVITPNPDNRNDSRESSDNEEDAAAAQP